MKISLVFESVDGDISDKEGKAFQTEYTHAKRSLTVAETEKDLFVSIAETFPKSLHSRITASEMTVNGRVYNKEKTVSENLIREGTFVVLRLALAALPSETAGTRAGAGAGAGRPARSATAKIPEPTHSRGGYSSRA